MHINVLTLFPSMLRIPFQESIIGKAVQRKIATINLIDIRDFVTDKHGTIDDYQYGGAPGMVLKVEPVNQAVNHAKETYTGNTINSVPVVLFSPRGRVFNQSMAEKFAKLPGMILICGHYTGVDERIVENIADFEVSLGDYVLTGGEPAALVVIDSVLRLVPGVIGSKENIENDSITNGLLQHPIYTRPQEYKTWKVPDVLLSGDHSKINLWRRKKSLLKTLHSRPDLLKKIPLTKEEILFLEEFGYKSKESTK